jgi:hypothetical protein
LTPFSRTTCNWRTCQKRHCAIQLFKVPWTRFVVASSRNQNLLVYKFLRTDGTIAAVYFDFVFKVDGKASNRGRETRQPVKAADGWRIASIIYSSEPPAQQ